MRHWYRCETRFFLWCALVALASGDRAWGVEPQVVLSQLANPCGLVVTADSGIAYLAESAAGRVLRVDIEAEKAEPIVVDFPVESYGKGPAFRIGPLGLALVGDSGILVGGGGDADDAEKISLFRLNKPGDPPIVANKAAQTLGPVASSRPSTGATSGFEGNFFSLVFDYNVLLATANGDDQKGWLVRSRAANEGFAPLETFIPTKEAAGVDAPVGLTLDGRGHVVVTNMGELNDDADSVLTYYELTTGRLLLRIPLPSPLRDVVAIAFGPDGRLVALDFSWQQPANGGLFQLGARQDAAGHQTVHAVRIATLVRPTALAFRKDGSLLVTTLGKGAETGAASGQLLLFPAGI